MQSIRAGVVPLGLALAVALSSAPRQRLEGQSREPDVKTPIRLIGVIPIPGNPLVTSDIIWVDQATRRLYVTDRSNFGKGVIGVEFSRR